MAPITPTRSSSKAPTTPRQSTLRRKGAEAFARSPFSSKNTFQLDDFKTEGRGSPSKLMQDQELEAEYVADSSPRVAYTSFDPFVPNNLEASKPHSSVEGEEEDGFILTAELFGSSESPFDADDEEGYDQSPSLRPSTLRRKTGELLGGRPYSSNPFDSEVSELDEPSPSQVARGKPLSSLLARIAPTKRAEASVSAVSAETDFGDATLEQTLAAEALSKQHLAASMSSPGLSTLKRRSADLFAQDSYFPSSAWDEDDDEPTQRFERVILDPTQRERGLTFKSLRTLKSPKSLSDPLSTVKTEVQDHDESRVMPWSKAEYRSWPDKKDLEANIQEFTTNRCTFEGRMHSSEVSVQSFESPPNASAGSSMLERALDNIHKIRGANMTKQEHDDFLHELLDKEWGDPNGLDAHDEVMQQFYLRNNDSLPASNPAGFPHLINYLSYTTDTDSIVQNARPRLADAVATTLLQTSHRCLADFLDPGVQVFEWCRNKQHMMIRRDGKHVIVGTYQNYGTCYVWNYFVRSEISETGVWKEVYAGASQVITPVSAEGIEFDKLVPGESIQGIDPTDEKYALYVGRALGQFMLLWEVWDFNGGYLIEWQADGAVRNAREILYEGLRMAREETEKD
ncbi:hypothetical protein SNOG_08218 [Parastagonospora nodorum SN15]|uniref:Uncharacterized protein n=1 Tax=Phaeosphaeria nodorum (strain SN15 / ATCC MYA-4574 / FGSC 10173) TaxID=321614 RepID=Q0UJ46_PHANO|nr:hypothetical protein SNOG_08218 [Parastagonospora nodorum SN15]EAT84494.2 hypothetical protein SNOG_08218 [Parastagonospora nodorum SN15]